MDTVIAIRSGSTVLTFLIFLGIVWWAYGRGRKDRFEATGRSVLLDDDDKPDEQRTGGRV